MARNFLNIVQVNTSDLGGGAEKVAWGLFTALRAQRHKSSFVVGIKKTNDKDIYQIPYTFWESVNFYCEKLFSPFRKKIKGFWRLKTFFHNLARPGNYFSALYGRECFYYPASKKILKINGLGMPDVINFHNLHGNYFDLRILPIISNQIPTIISLHDMWLLGGYCANSLNCNRWQNGCGNCPYLSLSVAITSDATAYNWKKKAKIYAKSKLFLVAPSDWVMKRVNQSILVPGIVESKIIYHGVDINIFKPAVKSITRRLLGFPLDAIIFIFVAHGAKTNPWKNFDLFKLFIAEMGRLFSSRKILGVCLGDVGDCIQLGNAKIVFVGFVHDQSIVAQYFQAADICIHLTNAETFSLAVIEALACGIPVIASCVGAIPELIKTIDKNMAHATGFCIKNEEIDTIIMAGKLLIENELLYKNLSYNAALDGKSRFNFTTQVRTYLDWYYYVIDRYKKINHKENS